jgi:hypothetical protein
MNRRETALVQGLVAAHRALLEAVERSIASVPRTTAPSLAPTPAPESPPIDPEDDLEVSLADVCTAAEIDQIRTLGETLTKAAGDGATMPRGVATWLKAFAEGA